MPITIDSPRWRCLDSGRLDLNEVYNRLPSRPQVLSYVQKTNKACRSAIHMGRKTC